MTVVVPSAIRSVLPRSLPPESSTETSWVIEAGLSKSIVTLPALADSVPVV